MSVHIAGGHHRPIDRNHLLRELSVALSALIGIEYVALFILVKHAEEGAAENTYGGYLFLAVAYVGLTLMLWLRGGPHAYRAGAVLQLVVITLFALFGIGAFGPGVFEYDAVASLHIAWWATTVGAMQVALFAACIALMAGPVTSRRSR